MDAVWIKSPTARRILMHFGDLRPAWLWSRDGSTLLWRNPAARLFNAKIKKSGLKLSAEAVPIKGQVARLIRLGATGRSSLSRVQFLAGDKPLATTCSCTPVIAPDGEPALLLVAVEPIEADLVEVAGEAKADAISQTLFPPGSDYLLVRGGQVSSGSAHALSIHKPEIDSIGLPEDGAVTRLAAGADGTTLLIYPPPAIFETPIATAREEEGDEADADADLASTPEPMLPLGLEPLPESALAHAREPGDDWVEAIPPTPDRQLSSLFDRLAGNATLYGTLTAEDEVFRGTREPHAAQAKSEPAAVEASRDALLDAGPITDAPLNRDEPTQEQPVDAPAPTDSPGAPGEDLIAAVIEYADDPEAPAVAPEGKSHWMITGRGFRALAPRPDPSDSNAETDASSQAALPAASDTPLDPSPGDVVPVATVADPELPLVPDTPIETVESVDGAPDAETAERVSRYNFEELGRILTDRVAAEGRPEPARIARPAVRPEGVINLNAETLVLNRLPLAILVFRDQQVLFANRALTDLLGHESVESLRAAGIASIFPNPDNASAGPVNQLVRRDNTLLPVSARLQSVSWQGRAALMLSASTAEPTRNHEAAVHNFAELAADARGEGFVAADRTGRIAVLSGVGRTILGLTDGDPVGKPLAALVDRQDMEPLRAFLEKPARFAETARPSLIAASDDGNADIALFAEGQAGIVTGYFGFIRKRERPVAAPTGDDADIEPSMLARLSRGVRRPLNTIIGFADLIRSAAFGKVDTERYAEYAGDIRTAGLEIAVLVDELDDFTRLRDGRYAPRPSDVDLAALLDSCMVRVKAQAAASRVLVRSAISEQLPRVRADRASLGQALLNLLASAIDQTPIGGSVILSAQAEEDGGVAIHVRDGAQASTDLAERFVVFRDGVDKDGEQLTPVRSSVGLALTRSLLAVNDCSLSVDPMMGAGTLFSLLVPADLVARG